MDGDATLPSGEALLEHAGFLRALAGGLLRDDARADEAVQETFVAALAHPPARRDGLRAWLAAVTRNVSLRMRRGEARRARRERAAARPERLSSALEIAARLDLERRVVHALERIEEPYRSALVHRYFDGFGPSAIAARLGVPVRTVESRIRRGLEKMRARLDAGPGGRRQWSLGLGAMLAMRTSTKTGLLAGLAAAGLAFPSLLAAAAFVAGYVARPHLAAPAPLEAQESRVSREEGERAALLGRIASLESRLGALPARPPAEAEAAASDRADAAGRPGPGRRFRNPATDAGVDAVDWGRAAEAFVRLRSVLDRLAALAEEGSPIPPELLGELQRWNGPLVNVALALVNAGVPGTGANGAFTHPTVVANSMHAVLAHAGIPLTPAQESRVEELLSRTLDEEARRAAAADPSLTEFEKIFAECAMKDRFFAELFPLLDEGQRSALHGERSRDRLMLDLWSSGCIWIQAIDRIRFSGEADLRAKVRGRLVGILGASRAPAVDAAVDAWIASHPPGFLEEKPDSYARFAFDSMERVRALAARQRALLEDLRGRIALSPEERLALDEGTGLFLLHREGP